MIFRYKVEALPIRHDSINDGVLISTRCWRLISYFSWKDMKMTTKWDEPSFTIDRKPDMPKGLKNRNGYYYEFYK